MCEPDLRTELTRGSGIQVVLLTREHAVDICTWRYPAPYDCYDLTDADPDEMLDAERGFHAVLDSDGLIGFRSFRPDGQVPGWPYDDARWTPGEGCVPS